MHSEMHLRSIESDSGSSAGTDERSSLDHFLDPLRVFLDDAQVTEICINRPGEAFIERYAGWTREALDFLSYDWCFRLAKLVANHTKQRIADTEPILSATLPGGERVQFVLPPATETGHISITIRRPSATLWTLDQLASAVPVPLAADTSASVVLDVFAGTRGVPGEVVVDGCSISADRELQGCFARGEFADFLRRAVQLRKNILLSGATGSGKTTLSKALILEVPAEDRIVTIEDVKELSLQNQPNSVRLFYSQGGQGLANVTPGSLLASAKRMRPDRIFVSELRTGDEVYDYLVSINSGHPGSITSVHADSADMAFLALAQLMKRSAAGRDMGTAEAIALAQRCVDVVVQCSRDRQRRFVSEIWYDPSAKRRRGA